MIDSFKGRWSFLSNFYPAEIEHRGIKYPTVEHYYVAMKVNSDHIIDGTHFSASDLREFISKISTAGRVKRFGRQSVELRKDWESVRYDVMLYGVRQKFKHEHLKEMLLQTGDEELVEGNWWHDVYFGVCDCGKCPKGQNILGKILMLVRKETIDSSLYNFLV